jgi:hypothetical protein
VRPVRTDLAQHRSVRRVAVREAVEEIHPRGALRVHHVQVGDVDEARDAPQPPARRGAPAQQVVLAGPCGEPPVPERPRLAAQDRAAPGACP